MSNKSEATRQGIDQIRQSGRKYARHIPFGFAIDPINPRVLILDPKEDRAVELMQGLKADGYSLRAIGAILDQQGVKPRAGKRWWATSVQSVLDTAETMKDVKKKREDERSEMDRLSAERERHRQAREAAAAKETAVLIENHRSRQEQVVADQEPLQPYPGSPDFIGPPRFPLVTRRPTAPVKADFQPPVVIVPKVAVPSVPSTPKETSPARQERPLVYGSARWLAVQPPPPIEYKVQQPPPPKRKPKRQSKKLVPA